MDIEDLPDTNEEQEVSTSEPVYTDEPTQFSIPEPEPTTGFSAFSEIEPEDALAEFNRTWKAKLEIKKAAEIEKERENKAKSAEELASWNQQRDIRLKAKKEKNRSEEQVFLESLESEADGSNTWERVTKLVDTKTGESADTHKADVSRMKKIFIQLKSDPLEKTRTQTAVKM